MILTSQLGTVVSRLGSIVLGPGGASVPAPPAAPSALNIRIDFARDGSFATSGDDVSDHVLSDSVSWTRGRSADFSAEATGAASFTLRNDDNAYAPGTLLPGMPVQIYATYSSVDYPLFFGYIERVTPDAVNMTIAVTCYDVLRRLGEITTVVPANPYIARSARDMRVEVLSDFERGTINLCHNGSAETNLDGWLAVADMTVSRDTGDSAPGCGAACISSYQYSADDRTEFPLRLAPVYFAGQTYRFSVWLKDADAETWVVGAYGGAWTGAGIADRVLTLTSSWVRYSFTVTLPATYTASAPLTFFIRMLSPTSGWGYRTVLADGLMVTRGYADPAYTSVVSGRWPNWCGNGSFGGGALDGWYGNGASPIATASSSLAISATAKYGAKSQAVTTLATAGSGVFYDFNHLGSYFLAGQPYTASLWLNPSSSMPYKVGIGGDWPWYIWDQASTTGTASANAWTHVTVTWTPATDQSAATAGWVLLSIAQTDATVRTVLINGVRVIPGSSADNFEEPWWNLTQEPDVYGTSAYLSGTALANLGQINGLTLSRHWISPTMTTPFYQYNVSSRDDLAVKVSAETYSDDVRGMTSADVDRASIVNLVPITTAAGTDYYPDQTSVDTYGERPTGTIDGSGFGISSATAQVIATALLARYSVPRARPQMTVVNRFPSQLQRELDDLVTVTYARLAVSAQKYLDQRIETKLSDAGNTWTTVYALEELDAGTGTYSVPGAPTIGGAS